MLVLLYCHRPPPTCLAALVSYPRPSLQPPLTHFQPNSAAVQPACSGCPVLAAVRSMVTVYLALLRPAAWVCSSVQVLHSVMKQILPLFLPMPSSMMSVQHCRKREKGVGPRRSSLLLLAQKLQVQVEAMTLVAFAVGHAVHHFCMPKPCKSIVVRAIQCMCISLMLACNWHLLLRSLTDTISSILQTLTQISPLQTTSTPTPTPLFTPCNNTSSGSA